MFLTLGKETVVRTADIIGIFDLDTSSQSRITRDFLSGAEKNGAIMNTAEDIPNAFLLCGEGGETKVCLTQTSSRNLYRRLK